MLGQIIEQIGSGIIEFSQCSIICCEEAVIRIFVEHGFEQIVASQCIENTHGFAAQTEGFENVELEEFIEGSDAAGQDGEGIRDVFHRGFSLVHAFGDDDLSASFEGKSRTIEDFGDDGDDLSIGFGSPLCDGTHNALVVTAVNEIMALRGEHISEVFSDFVEFRVEGFG